MSPSLIESLRIGLCPEKVVTARYSRGLRPKLIDKSTLRVEAAAAGEPWEASLAALAKHLQNPSRTADATVVLSNHFVRYLFLESKEALRSEAEWLAYAAHQFERTHGARATEWDIQVSAAGAENTRLASAIDKALLDATTAAFKNRSMRLRSIEPYLVTAFNRTLPALPDSPFWFVLQEPGRLLLGLIREGAWRSIRGRRATANWSQELRDTVEREGALLALGEPCRRVMVSAMDPVELPVTEGYEFTAFAGPAEDDRPYAMVRA